MNYAALKAQLEKRAKELIAKRDGHDVEVEEDDEVFGSNTGEVKSRSAAGMSKAEIKAELARRLAQYHSKK